LEKIRKQSERIENTILRREREKMKIYRKDDIGIN